MEGKRMSGLLEVTEENVHEAEQEKIKDKKQGFFPYFGWLNCQNLPFANKLGKATPQKQHTALKKAQNHISGYSISFQNW